MDNLKDDLTQEDIALIRKYENFYRSLESGDREPATEAQKHFVAVCNMEAEVNTPHELAWMRYKNKIKRDNEFRTIEAASNSFAISPKLRP